jgi:hypothetical protein
MNLSQLNTAVLQIVGRDDVSDVSTAINRALQTISTDHIFNAWKETFSITTNINDDSDPDDPRVIALPSNLKTIYSLSLIDGTQTYPLQRLFREEYDLLFRNMESNPTTGKPTHYTVFARNLEVYPQQDKDYTYRLRGVKRPAVLSSDTDEPEIAYDNVIIECSAMIVFNNYEMVEESKEAYYRYKSFLKGAITEDQALAGDLDSVVKPYNNPTMQQMHHSRNRVF